MTPRDFIKYYSPILLLSLLAVSACSSSETDTEASITADAGADVDDEIPSVESIEIEGSSPGTTPRIHVESATKHGVISETPLLSAKTYLSQELASTLVTGTDLEAIQITGQTPSETHNSIRYAPTGAEDHIFGIGLQVWDLAGKEITTNERLTELREQFLNVSDADFSGAPEGSFISNRSGIRSFIFPANSSPYLFVLSCDVDHCHSWEDLYEVGSQIASSH